VIFTNRIAAFLWGFALVWVIVLVIFTGLLVRDGPPEGWSREAFWALMAIFWLGGFGIARYALSKPCYFVSVDPSGMVQFAWQYPHRRETKRFPSARLATPNVVDGTDDEGNPYFYARLDLPDGSTTCLTEGHDRSACEIACDRFTKAIAKKED